MVLYTGHRICMISALVKLSIFTYRHSDVSKKYITRVCEEMKELLGKR